MMKRRGTTRLRRGRRDDLVHRGVDPLFNRHSAHATAVAAVPSPTGRGPPASDGLLWVRCRPISAHAGMNRRYRSRARRCPADPRVRGGSRRRQYGRYRMKARSREVSPELESRDRETLGQTTTRPAGLQGRPRGPYEPCCGSWIVSSTLPSTARSSPPLTLPSMTTRLRARRQSSASGRSAYWGDIADPP